MPGSNDVKPINVHIEVAPEFHRELKMMCAYKSVKLKDYALEALREKLDADRVKIQEQKKSAAKK